MLERIYIDNYKCLVNFEYRPGKLQLLLGGNGSGKSTVFEVLGLLRRFLVDGEPAGIFAPSSRTRWDMRTTQSFELGVARDSRSYAYKLVIEHQEKAPHCRLRYEELRLNGDVLFSTREEWSPDQPRPVYVVETIYGVFLVRPEYSAVPELSYGSGPAEFSDWISKLYCIQMNPYAMSAESKEEAPYPLRDLANYASWYRHISQEQPRVRSTLTEYLKPIIPGFGGFALTREGETARTLRAEVSDGSSKPHRYGFGELSEGQRALAGLYTLLALMKETPITLCIDEPDNFVALREIQPWLLELHDVVEEHGSQALIISHHPELINYLAPRDAVLFSRAPEGPVRVAPFAPESDEPLTAAEIVARGWEERAEGE